MLSPLLDSFGKSVGCWHQRTCSIIAVQKRRDGGRGGGEEKKDPKDGLRMAGRGRLYALLQASFTFSAAGVQPFKAIGVLSTNANGLRFPILSLIFYDLSSDTKTWKRSTHLLLKCTSFLPGLFVLSLLFDFLATGEDVCNIPEIVSNMGIPCGMPLRVDCSVMLSRVGCVSLSLVPFCFCFFFQYMAGNNSLFIITCVPYLLISLFFFFPETSRE